VFNKDVKVPLHEAELVGTSSSNSLYTGGIVNFFGSAVRLHWENAKFLSTIWPFLRSSCKQMINSCTGVLPLSSIDASTRVLEKLWTWLSLKPALRALLTA
jgi:hypothetical protein